MRIKIKDLTLKSDAYCYVLGKERVRIRKGKKLYEMDEPTYHSSMEESLMRAGQRALRDENCSTLTEVLAELKSLRLLIDPHCKLNGKI